jgi:uroporphyrin-III C-methyltransferase/precorrin-2 dehydrogenase/sirohydrochlorin ferrochelatase
VQYLPLFVKLTDKPVLIVGGGSVALRKAGTLLSAGATLYVVSPAFATELKATLSQLY